MSRQKMPEWVFDALLFRSSGLCEARTHRCLAGPDGNLSRLSRGLVSIQHRLARGMGGTSREDVHNIQDLLVVCGHGTVGCHWWIEDRRPGMEERGLWRRHRSAQAELEQGPVPVILRSGRIVLLHERYETVGWFTGPHFPGDPVEGTAA